MVSKHWLFFASCSLSSFFFFFNDTATTEIYTLSLHDALPIFHGPVSTTRPTAPGSRGSRPVKDRKSTRLNSSHGSISYAVFCLKKKKKHHSNQINEKKPNHNHRHDPMK